MTITFGGQGVQPTLRGQPSNVLSLKGGEVFTIPAGTWQIALGPYSVIQEYDAIRNAWRTIGGDSNVLRYVNSDGVNYRASNLTGCVVGVVVTTAGSLYTSPPTVTDNGGATTPATYQAIIGGAVATSVTVTNGGKNYTEPPTVIIDAPPSPGIQATATCTISGGAVTTVTIVNQGAGYTNVPTLTFRNDPRDSTGVGASGTATLTGAGTVTGILVVDHGSPITSTTTPPTLTLTGGGGSSAAATAIMCWSITGYTSITSAGSGYTGNVEITTLGNGLTASAALTNPQETSNLVRGRPAAILAALSGGAVVTSGQTVFDGGIFAGQNTTQIINGTPTGTGAAVAQVVFAYGSYTDTITLLPV